jgi:phosphomannomutase / phosphoglucomutase
VNASLKKSKKKQSTDKAPRRSLAEQVQYLLAEKPQRLFIGLTVALVLLLDAALGLWAWQRFVVQEQLAMLDKLSQQQVRKLSVNVGNYMDATQKRIAFFAQNAELAHALAAQDALALKEFRRAIQNQLPKADEVRLIPAGTAQLDQTAKIPLRFLELELIKAAEKRQPQKIEAVKLPVGWRLHLILPVPDKADQPVAGTLMVTLPMDDLVAALTEGVAGNGQISLLQLYDKQQTHVLHVSGEGSRPPSVRKDVHATPWLVDFIPNETLAAQVQSNHLLLMVEFLVGVLLSLALATWLGTLWSKCYARRREADNTQQFQLQQTAGKEDLSSVSLQPGHEDLLGLADADPADSSPLLGTAPPTEELDQVPAHIFRAYDIRGLAESDIDKDLAYKIGQAVGSELLDNHESTLVVAKDARTHSPLLAEYLIRGLMSTGCKVVNLGTVPTPLMYFATQTLGYTQSGVVVTASHNPAAYNGFKLVMKGKTRMEADIQSIRERIERRQFRSGIGTEEHLDIIPAYIDAIYSDVALAGDMSIVIDAANGVAGRVAPRLFEELGCQVTALYCDLDGTFPNHGPDPSQESNLQDLIHRVKEENAHLGVAFDGDGDRLVVVTPQGQIIWPDRLLMLFAKDILARNPGADVVFDVKCSRLLNTVISSQGGRPIMWRTGHAPMKAKMQQTGALLGGEYSGHIFIKDRWYGFDDGLYAAARLIEIISLRDQSIDEIFAEFPPLPNTPEYRVPVEEQDKFDLVQRLADEGDFGEAKLNTLDGLRVEYPYGWGIVRASNTEACLTLRFEAETDADIHKLKALFTREIRKLDHRISFSW